MSVESRLDYAVAELSDGSLVKTPFWKLNSGADGESFLITAVQHGNEVQGAEVIRRFRQICERELKKGTVYLVPFANIPALRHRRSHISLKAEQPYAEHEGHNMNRTWPGDSEGNDTERVAWSLHEAVVQHCTRCLDLHSWSRFTATATLARHGHEISSEMAMASAIRFVHWSHAASSPEAKVSTITTLFNDSDRGAICIELAPQWVIREKEVAQGLRAACNMARLFGMMDGEPELLEGPVVSVTEDNEDQRHSVQAPCSGLFAENGLETSDYVEKGQKLGHIISDEDLSTVEIAAPASGYLWRYGCHREHSDVRLPDMHPYAAVGDGLATVAVP